MIGMRHLFILRILLIVFSFYIISLSPAHGFDMAKNYTLPYPPLMPGSIFYKIRIVEEKLGKVWNFGSFAQFQYNLSLSDRYLVQARTLIEYQQYLLASEALMKSDTYFQKTLPNLSQAITEKKNILDEKELLRHAAQKHIDVITMLKTETPKTFNWQPENSNATNISFVKMFETSIKIRQKAL